MKNLLLLLCLLSISIPVFADHFFVSGCLNVNDDLQKLEKAGYQIVDLTKAGEYSYIIKYR